MALRDSALNIVINARDLTGNALNRLRRRLQDTDQAAARASTSLGDMVKRVAALAAAALGLSALTRAMTGMLRTGDEFERLGITMESLMGSIEGGQAAIRPEWSGRQQHIPPPILRFLAFVQVVRPAAWPCIPFVLRDYIILYHCYSYTSFAQLDLPNVVSGSSLSFSAVQKCSLGERG